jgi:sodium/bile acid cotransporter 7
LRLAWPAQARPDPYILAILATVVAASVAPARGHAAHAFGILTWAAIALLFFLHGARLSREAVIAGLTQWRLHLTILAATFVLFPLLGLAVTRLPAAVLPTSLAAGVLFLCCLPSTVQSSIAFTSIARGNVAAAVCAASASSLIGIFLTPVLAAALLSAHGTGFSLKSVRDVALQLLAPFAAGQLARPFILTWLTRRGRLVGLVDQASILLVVYGAFSAAVVQGIWKEVSPREIAILIVICIAILAVALLATAAASRALKFSTADEIAVVFAGSKKSLAAGVPMASILFPAASVGVFVLPLMIFHQIQLMACALIARRYAARPPDLAQGAEA